MLIVCLVGWDGNFSKMSTGLCWKLALLRPRRFASRRDYCTAVLCAALFCARRALLGAAGVTASGFWAFHTKSNCEASDWSRSSRDRLIDRDPGQWARDHVIRRPVSANRSTVPSCAAVAAARPARPVPGGAVGASGASCFILELAKDTDRPTIWANCPSWNLDGSMGLPLCLSLFNTFKEHWNLTHYLLGWDQGEDQQCNEAGGEDGLRGDHARGRHGGHGVRQRGHHHARSGQGGAGRPEAEDEGEEVYGMADEETRQGPQWSLQHHVVTRRAYEGIERYLWI